MKNFLRDTVMTLVMAAVIFFGLQVTVQSFIVDGPSMNPNYHTGQWLLVNKVVYRFHDPERGDVVILLSPNNHQEDYIKRIIGLPGESVEIKDGVVYIHKEDGKILKLDEKPYITEQARDDYTGGKIPANEYFVLGRTPAHSNNRLGIAHVSFNNAVYL